MDYVRSDFPMFGDEEYIEFCTVKIEIFQSRLEDARKGYDKIELHKRIKHLKRELKSALEKLEGN